MGTNASTLRAEKSARAVTGFNRLASSWLGGGLGGAGRGRAVGRAAGCGSSQAKERRRGGADAAA